MQGWAIVENTTEENWNKVNLTLVSGRPISFIMDLYQPLYVQRPVVEPELWVTANFKESELTRMRPGQRVRISSRAMKNSTAASISTRPAMNTQPSPCPAQTRKRPIAFRIASSQSGRCVGGGGLGADEGGVAGAVEVTYPDYQDIVAEDSGGPGVAEAPGGAGFPGDVHSTLGAYGLSVGPGIFLEHLRRHEGGLLRQELGADGFAIRQLVTHRMQHSAVREHCV